MTPQSELEIQGNFFTHPFAELISEIMQARVNGSLRVSNKEKKCVIYLKNGEIVFAVSNARAARLFDILLTRNRMTKDDVTKIPNFSNDHELVAYLEDKKFLTKADTAKLFSEQIESILVDILTWDTGEWDFSSLRRIRDGLAYDVETRRILFDFGRCMPIDKVLGRFRSLDERFHRSDAPPLGINLRPDEAFVLSRTGEDPLTVTDLISISGMAEANAFHAIYTLWLGGLIIRDDWQPAFTNDAISAMRSAKLELKTEAKTATVAAPEVFEQKPQPAPAEPKIPEVTITLEEYLERVENAETYYDLLGVDPASNIADVKRAYFSLAKEFHPDRYHADGGDMLPRIQNAFTELAQAHETLKNPENRELYDYRMRKELATREKRAATGETGNASLASEQAAQNFERGFSMLVDGEVEQSLPFLARAVHYAPKNARFHAYYGKALSFDDSKRHKAESEMQAALKLDPQNPTFRILLAEFFIQYNLKKRAEGELTRLLAVFPSNREAQDLLDSLQKPAR
ncbi:MAG: DnaJ domain-containing protein [Pyrinomonadaceae bacterium]